MSDGTTINVADVVGNNFQEKFNLEDRAVLFMAMLIGYLALQVSFFLKIFYDKFIGSKEKISDVLNQDWKISDYISRKIKALSWLSDFAKKIFQKI